MVGNIEMHEKQLLKDISEKQSFGEYINDNNVVNILPNETLAQHLSDKGYRKQEWISVEDRLPNKDELVLCIGAKGGMFLGDRLSLYRDEKSAYAHVPNSNSGRQAVYWMPLPQPPKMRGE